MSIATKTFILLIVILALLGGAGVFLAKRTAKVSEVAPSPSLSVSPPPAAMQERILGVETRMLAYTNGRKAADSTYYGTEPDVITVIDALSNEVLATINTTITPDARGQQNQYVLVGDQIYFYHQTDRVVEVMDFSGTVRKLEFTQSPPDRHYHNFMVSEDGKRITWARAANAGGISLRTAIWAANINGSQQQLLLEQVFSEGKYFVVYGFTDDQAGLYYSEEYVGGSFSKETGLSDLHILTIRDKTPSVLVPRTSQTFIGDIDQTRQYFALVNHDSAGKGLLEIRKLELGEKGLRTVRTSDGFDLLMGIRFSPNAKRLVYTELINSGDAKGSRVMVHDLENSVEGQSIVLKESSSVRYVAEKWLTNNIIVLTSDSEPGAYYTIQADGTGFQKLGEKVE